MNSIEQRLARLERENRAWRLGALATLVLIGAGLCVAAASGEIPAAPADGVIRGKTLYLSEGKGSASVVIESQANQASLLLASPSKKSVVSVIVDDKTATIRLSRDGIGGAEVILDANGPDAHFFDKDDKPRPIAVGR